MKSGKVSENILKRSVLRQIGTHREEVADGAGAGRDCAIFSFGGDGMTVTCMQEAVVAVRGKSSEILAGGAASPEPFWSLGQLILKCANNLAAAGAEPVAVMLALLLPEDVQEQELKALMAEAEESCAELSVELMGGQTRVTGQVRSPVAVVTGYGRSWDAERQSAGVRKAIPRIDQAVRPGQDIVISKWIGLQGTALLARRNREKLLERYPAHLVDEAAQFDRYLSVVPEARAAVQSGVCAMHDASEGGIFGALWELAERSGAGLDLDLRKLPLRQETVEVCECCDVNPYELLSGGCLIMAAQDGPGLAAALQAQHIPAVIVGKVTGRKDRILRNGDEIRFLDRPQQDQIYKNSPETEAPGRIFRRVSG